MTARWGTAPIKDVIFTDGIVSSVRVADWTHRVVQVGKFDASGMESLGRMPVRQGALELDMPAMTALQIECRR